MADDVVNMLPPRGAFGSMSREELMDMTQHPPKPDAERGFTGGDPLAGISQLNAVGSPRQMLSRETTNAQPNVEAGKRYYHTKHKFEVTCISLEAGSDKAVVQADNGAKYKASVKNLRFIG